LVSRETGTIQRFLFDTHCHLCSDALFDCVEDVIERASRSGVSQIMVPGIDAESSCRAAALASCHEGVWAAAGVHPNSLGESTDCDFSTVKRLLLEPGVIAVGETGLDFYREDVPAPVQRDWLHRHIDLAADLGYPLILHSRSAEEDLLDELPSCMDSPVILHCYTGIADTACRAGDRGFYVGFAGPLTYRANEHLRESVRHLPGDRILVETDSPYLSPEPFRGRRNEPERILLIAEAIASARGILVADALDMLWENSLNAFQLGGEKGKRTDLLYRLGNSLYANISGECNCDCIFCLRFRQTGIGGYHLEHVEEPSVERLVRSFEMLEPGWFDEIVFCGFGEPTTRPGLLVQLAGISRCKGYSTRLDTNGLALELMPVERARELLVMFDFVSVSLNESSAEAYARICRTCYSDPWSSHLRFIRLAVECGCRTTLTAVRYPGVDLEGTAALAKELGLPFRIRG
jgi:TatD DNase family protein